MYVIMNNYFWSSLINEPAVFIFILWLCLLEVQTNAYFSWETVIVDLEAIPTAYPEIDTSLYTADSKYLKHCSISVVKCFYLEMKVLSHEANIGGNKILHNNVSRIERAVGRFLKKEEHKETTWCQECETFEEKPYTKFIENFIFIAKQLYREMEEKRKKKP